MEKQFFKPRGKYTLVYCNLMAFTVREEITIIRISEGETFFKRKKKMALHPLKTLSNVLVFAGHHLPFLLDAETPRFMGSATINFVTDNPEILKKYIEENCLNLEEIEWNKIRYSPVDRSKCAQLSPLF